MTKVVLKLEVHDNKEKRKAMKLVSSLQGIESIAMDMNEKKLTVIGDVDPVCVVSKLRKSFHADILTVGPEKEPEKKKDPPEKTEEEIKKAQMDMIIREYCNQRYMTYPICRVEEDPNSCVIS